MLDFALKYYDLGYSIIPLRPRDKRPNVKSWERFKSERATKEQIIEWWTKKPDCNIGIITGAISNLTVVDLDTDKVERIFELKLPNTLMVKTSRGFHAYFKYAKDFKSIKGYKGFIEVQNDGHYVVAPPSIHESGHIYNFVNPDHPIEEFPHECFEVNDKVSNTIELSSIKDGVQEGNRNNSAAAYIGSLLHGLPQSKYNLAWTQVKEWNTHNTPPLAQNELLSVFNSIAGKEFKTTKNQSGGENLTEKTEFKIKGSEDWLAMEITEFPYLINKMVPRKGITSLTADSGKGKSIIAVLMAKAIAEGNPLFGEFETIKTKVLIIDQEMDEDLIAERYQAIFDEPCDVDIMAQQFWNITDDEHFEWMVETIKNKNYGLIVLDTLTTIHDKEENSASEMREVNQRLLKLIADTGVAILYLHHHRKPMKGEKNSQSSSRGSTEIIAKVASHLMISSIRSFDDDQLILDIKISQGKARRPEGIETIEVKVIYNQTSKKTTWEYIGEVDEESNAVDEAVEWLREQFDQCEYTTINALTILAGQLDEPIPESTIRRALGWMKKNVELKSMTKSKLIEGGYATREAVEKVGNRVHFYVKLDNQLDY